MMVCVVLGSDRGAKYPTDPEVLGIVQMTFNYIDDLLDAGIIEVMKWNSIWYYLQLRRSKVGVLYIDTKT